jgi:curved DNA-binding protein CbpA
VAVNTRAANSDESLTTMLRFEAMVILGLTFVESLDEAKIKQVWKQKIKHVHPDKNKHTEQESSTNATQLLNEARDALLEPFHDSSYEKKRQEDEEEQVLREKRRAEAEAKRQAEDTTFEQKSGTSHVKFTTNDNKRENLNKIRKKRLPTSRVHRNINEYKEGKALIEEMQTFFQDSFKEVPDNVLWVGDILDLFVKSRDSTSVLETNLFKRHAKQLFLTTWPNSSYSIHQNKRCFRDICVK